MRYENISSIARDEPTEITYANRFAGNSVFVLKGCYRNSNFLLQVMNEERWKFQTLVLELLVNRGMVPLHTQSRDEFASLSSSSPRI